MQETQAERLSSVPYYSHSDTATRPVYEAAQRFVDAALRADDSLLTPGHPVWSLAHIEALSERLGKQAEPEQGERRDFETLLQQQLEGAAAAVYQLAAEALYVHLLIASDGIGAQAKRRLITSVLGWSPAPVGIPAELDQALEQGVARVGSAFSTHRREQVQFLLQFARTWKGLPADERSQALADPWHFKVILFALPVGKAYTQREALLHLVHPHTFAAVVSREQKRRLAESYASYITQATDDIDQQLAQIQHNYTQQHGQTPALDTPEQAAPAGTAAPAASLHLSIQFISQLEQAAYTPARLAELFQRSLPPGSEHAALPEAASLVEHLRCLRLLEALEGGSFRRWPYLAAASVPHLLRYVALTLLLPAGDGGYSLPASALPFDGLTRPAAAWPYDEKLLAWYAEAGLIQRHANGSWHALPAALQPLADTSPIAQVINTFLAHLHSVRSAQADQAALPDETLPIIDVATLHERIGELQRELLIDRMTILRIYRSLLAGQHIILSGPPGTGKTHLASLLPRVLWRDASDRSVLAMPTDPALPPTAPPIRQQVRREGYDVELATATEDWGLRHVIGGIVPQVQRNEHGRHLVYGVRHGCLTRAVLANYGGDAAGGESEQLPPGMLRRQEVRGAAGQRFRGRWLVIDEFTRAPIDAAFGSLLTTLGGQHSPLLVPTEDGREVPLPLPGDFRIIGTLNSFDRHFLNQLSEAMKRRFTFIDILPPGREHAAAEQGIAVYRALQQMQRQGISHVSIDREQGAAVWAGVLRVTRRAAAEGSTQYSVQVEEEAGAAGEALASFWRIFSAVRIYRQLGTAQAEAACTTLFTGWSIGMAWPEALDSALADTLADQLQVLHQDEQRILLAFIAYADDAAGFAAQVQQLLLLLPASRQAAHLAQLRAAATAAGDERFADSEAHSLAPEQLARLFQVGAPLQVGAAGLFARRLRAFVDERGL